MQILIVNDDGITNEGIIELARWAVTIGDVIVIAPDQEQSGKSQSVNLHNEFRAWKTDFAVKEIKEAWAVQLSPADCVAFGYHYLGLRPDYVFSGINRGYNIGKEIAYSGTCGAILEACTLGLKAVAFSTRARSLSVAVANLQKGWDYLIGNGLFSRCAIWNINYPDIPAPDMEIRMVRTGGIYLPDHIDHIEGDVYKRARIHGSLDLDNMETDIGTVTHGHIAVTPLTVDQTDHAALGH
ncbi:MAG: hypothetical protein J5891_08690 [Spirochaetales bacterium]|nr:hypothetical protein [Spirochaetales bacterium]